MQNNDVLRRLRYALDLDDDAMMNISKKGGLEVTRALISDWLKKEDNPEYKAMHDRVFAQFLNGFIIYKRGPSDKPMPEAENRLVNNQILRKLKIALDLNEEAMLEVFGLMNFKVSKHELSAFFRKPDQDQYRECKDQFLRVFLDGLIKKFRK
jgi:uncharacterized protein YehS (DUF1456 family)